MHWENIMEKQIQLLSCCDTTDVWQQAFVPSVQTPETHCEGPLLGQVDEQAKHLLKGFLYHDNSGKWNRHAVEVQNKKLEIKKYTPPPHTHTHFFTVTRINVIFYFHPCKYTHLNGMTISDVIKNKTKEH